MKYYLCILQWNKPVRINKISTKNSFGYCIIHFVSLRNKKKIKRKRARYWIFRIDGKSRLVHARRGKTLKRWKIIENSTLQRQHVVLFQRRNYQRNVKANWMIIGICIVAHGLLMTSLDLTLESLRHSHVILGESGPGLDSGLARVGREKNWVRESFMNPI